MHVHKHVPALATSQGKVCPICGRTSYSRDGIHPQCSFFQADLEFMAQRQLRLADIAALKKKA